MESNIAVDPLQRFLDTPVLLVYRLKNGKLNAMTNGAWTWYSKYIQGTIHEFGNHSFTYKEAENIESMSMIFFPPTKESVDTLLYFGSNSAQDVNKMVQSGILNELVDDGEFTVHNTHPTFCLKPIDCHKVIDLFKLVTTRFVKAINGYPHERIMDEHGEFFRMVKEEIK